MNVIKRNGEVEKFDEYKVYRSLNNSGVSKEASKNVLNEIKSRKFNSISTSQLYHLIYKLVSKFENKYSASIYTLKKAIMRLGPDGYSFEDYIAKIMKFLGYNVKTRQVYESMCITHELDVVSDEFFIECKYHNKGGLSSSVKDVLYSHARFLDLKNANKAKGYNFKNFWVATDTRFSPDAVKYAEYWGFKIMSWKYKGKDSLSYIVDKNQLYPVTLLPSVSRRVFKVLSENNIILLKEVFEASNKKLKSMGLFDDEINKIRKDSSKIIELGKSLQKEEDKI